MSCANETVPVFRQKEKKERGDEVLYSLASDIAAT